VTDRLKGCLVVFERDIREDDATAILDAIRMIRGVESLTVSIATPDDYMNRERIRSEYIKRIAAVFDSND
jgi:hypothetical protein